MAQTPLMSLPIGRDQPALSIPGNQQIRGITIDNPSGSWLRLRPTGDFIPPYTIGFMRSFEYGHASIAIEFPETGPSGQISTEAGNNPTVQLFSEPIGSAAGSTAGVPYIEQFTPILSETTLGTVTVSTGLAAVALIPAPPVGERNRVLTLRAAIGISFGADYVNDSPVSVWIRGNNNLATYERFILDSRYTVHAVNYSPGLDLDIDDFIELQQAETLFHDVDLVISVTYQVI